MISFLKDQNLIFDIFELIITDPIPLQAFNSYYFLCFRMLSLVDLCILAFSDSF